MGSVELPHRDSPGIRLVVATASEEGAQQRANSDEWKGPLSLEAYLEREHYLANQLLTQDDGITPWVLVYQPEVEGPRQVLCGCETINKSALVARDGTVDNVICHGIASVFCAPRYRGRGYAGRMIAMLGEKLEHWQTEGGKVSLFSILFSDIGKEFYASRGYHPYASAHITLSAQQKSAPAGVRLLKTEDLPELCDYDETILRNRMAKLSLGHRTAVAIVPDSRHAAWHHAREEFVAQKIYNGKSPDIKGAIVGDTPGSRVWAYWTRVWTNSPEDDPNTLHILRLVIEDDSASDFAPASNEGVEGVRGSEVAQAISAIFAVAQSEAARWDCKQISIWNPASVTLAAAQLIDPNIMVEHRESESIASLRWYGSASHKDVDWVENMKYAWC